MASRGKFPLRGTNYPIECAYEEQRLVSSAAVESVATKANCRRRADLPPAKEAQHFPNGSHAFAKGVTNPSDSEHRGHYPTTCMARVKQVKRRPNLAWYLRHLCTRLGVVRLPQMSN